MVCRSRPQYGEWDTTDEISDFAEYKLGNIVCVDLLYSIQKVFILFSNKRLFKKLDVFYLCESYFDLPERKIRLIFEMKVSFEQPLKDVDNIYKDLIRHDVTYEVSKYLCREKWRDDEKFNLPVHPTKMKDRGV